MKINTVRNFLFTVCLLSGVSGLYGQSDSIAVDGQISSWINYNFNNEAGQAAVRFIPELYYQHEFKSKLKLDLDLSANAYAILSIPEFGYDDNTSGLELYRASARLSDKQWEIRAGLQKISFGPASLLRPLMWFDGTDPRDPLKLTAGVYGLLGRYYFLNNANIWVWGLLGNESRRGWDQVPSLETKPEFGGRLQTPLFGGEAGISYNHRNPGSNKPYMPDVFPYESFQYNEDKIGIDGKWTIGSGLWFEYVYKRNSKKPAELYTNEHYLCLGTDYTFGIGNGINLLIEQFIYSGNNSLLHSNKQMNLTAASLSYPLGLMNRISAMAYKSWGTNDWYSFLNFQRQYDNLSLYLMLFWNPETSNNAALPVNQLYSGKGAMFMATYNF